MQLRYRAEIMKTSKYKFDFDLLTQKSIGIFI